MVPLLPRPLVVAEFGGIFEPEGSRPADIDGEGEEVEELIPFVCIPGGIGRLILPACDWAAMAEGAISDLLRSADYGCCRARWLFSFVMDTSRLSCPSR